MNLGMNVIVTSQLNKRKFYIADLACIDYDSYFPVKSQMFVFLVLSVKIWRRPLWSHRVLVYSQLILL